MKRTFAKRVGNVSGDGRDAFKALEGRMVLYFQVQVLALFLGEVTGN